MNKTENKTEGLTLYTLQPNYSGDTTKNCGLTGGEIDANFLFLRGNDIYSGEINEENNTLILRRGNEELITISNIRKDTQITSGYINNATGELVLETNGDDIIITGFTSSLVFTDTTLNGDGSTNNPIRLSELYKSPYLPSVKTVVDLTNNEVIQEEYKTTGTYIITKEYDNSNGLLYNFNGVKEIESKLKENNSIWRIPTFEDWGQMLNALEICDDRNHLIIKNGDFGKFAGAYLKNDGLDWIKKTETTISYGFKANPTGFKTSVDDTDSNYGYKTRFWTSKINEYDEVWVKELDTNKNTVKTAAGDKEGLYSLRLVRDYTNVDLVNEEILGSNYDIIRMPYVEVDAENNVTQRGYRVWTSVNVNFSEINKSNYTEVNDNTKTKTPLFYLNYWNGNNWVKRLVTENNVVTVENWGNREYKLINGELKLLNTSTGSDDIDLSNYYTKREVDDLINKVNSGEIDLAGYYTKDEVNTIIDNLNSEATYLRNILSNVLDMNFTKKDNEKYTISEMGELPKMVKYVLPFEEESEANLNEIYTEKQGSTVFIDLNSSVIGDLTDI